MTGCSDGRPVRLASDAQKSLATDFRAESTFAYLDQRVRTRSPTELLFGFLHTVKPARNHKRSGSFWKHKRSKPAQLWF